jgi:CheY-like chemotaxis protein
VHLLVVDDDASAREALALVLGVDGFEVTTAGDGREAIALGAVAGLYPAVRAARLAPASALRST